MLSKLKNMMFEEDGKSTLPPPSQPPQAPGQPQYYQPVPGARTPTPTAYSPVDQEMYQRLKMVATSRVTSFKTLKESTKKLDGIIPDEPGKIRAAFAMLSNEARTPAQILQAVDMHLSDIDSEVTKFMAQAEARKASTITQLDNEINNTASMITNSNRTIETLSSQIGQEQIKLTDLNTKMIELQGKRSNIENEIALTTSKFTQAADAVKAELMGDRNTLQSVFNMGA